MGWYFQVYFLKGVRFPPKFEIDFLAWSCQNEVTNKTKFAVNLKLFWK